jgi:hypothetical protein
MLQSTKPHVRPLPGHEAGFPARSHPGGRNLELYLLQTSKLSEH